MLTTSVILYCLYTSLEINDLVALCQSCRYQLAMSLLNQSSPFVIRQLDKIRPVHGWPNEHGCMQLLLQYSASWLCEPLTGPWSPAPCSPLAHLIQNWFLQFSLHWIATNSVKRIRSNDVCIALSSRWSHHDSACSCRWCASRTADCNW